MPIFDVDIRGTKYQIDAPDEAQAATQLLKLSQQPQHPAFDGSNIPGYDPATGIVSGGAIDDKTGQEYATGIRQGVEGTLGLPGDIGPLAGRGAIAALDKLGVDHGAGIGDTVSKLVSAAVNPVGAVLPYNNAVSTEQIQQNVTNPVLGETGPVLTEKGQIARSSGNFAVGAFAPGGPVRKALSMILPVAGGEVGAAVAPKGYEDYGRFAGQWVGGAATVPKFGGKPIVGAARDLGVTTKDLTRVIKRMQQDGLTPQQIQTRLTELGPDATLMDVGPNLRQEGQRIYAQGGTGRSVIDDVLTPRDQGANARIRSELDANLGPAPVPSQIDAGLKRTQRSLSPAYERVLGDAKAVDTEAIANDIQSMIANSRGEAKSALERVRGMLTIDGTNVLDPHPRAALATRQAIDGMIGATQDQNVRRILGDFRKRLDTELGAAAPGIKEVDAKYANLAKQRTAVERGQTVLDSGRTSPRPVELAAEVAKGGPIIQGRLSQGARAEIDRIVGTNANDRVALQRVIKGEGDWNREKLATMFGQDKADRMIAVLDREKTFTDTSNRIMKNSATAERMADGSGGFGALPSWKSGGMLGLARSVASDIGEKAFDKMRSSAAQSRDSSVAGLISRQDRNRLVTSLIKANGGKPLPQERINTAIRALLLTDASSQSAN